MVDVEILCRTTSGDVGTLDTRLKIAVSDEDCTGSEDQPRDGGDFTKVIFEEIERSLTAEGLELNFKSTAQYHLAVIGSILDHTGTDPLVIALEVRPVRDSPPSRPTATSGPVDTAMVDMIAELLVLPTADANGAEGSSL